MAKAKFKLDPKKKKKWVAALRSGRYKQGEGALKKSGFVDGKKETQYCCLGVARACHLTIQDRTVGEYVKEKFLPQIIQDDLASKNDSGKWSFKRIATWIEKHL